MAELAHSSALRAELGRAAAERVRTGPFSWAKKVEQTVAIYREVLADWADR